MSSSGVQSVPSTPPFQRKKVKPVMRFLATVFPAACPSCVLLKAESGMVTVVQPLPVLNEPVVCQGIHSPRAMSALL